MLTPQVMWLLALLGLTALGIGIDSIWRRTTHFVDAAHSPTRRFVTTQVVVAAVGFTLLISGIFLHSTILASFTAVGLVVNSIVSRWMITHQHKQA